MKVAIVGLGPGGQDAPFGEWSCWALLWDRFSRIRANAVFEMHNLAEIEDMDAADDLEPGTPIYWQHRHKVTSGGCFVPYPLDDVIEDIGRDWFESSVSYMVALAIHQGAEEIGLWGVHGDDKGQYLHQRPNLSWLLGLAEGRGIRVTLPDQCRLLTYTGNQYPVRYGYR